MRVANAQAEYLKIAWDIPDDQDEDENIKASVRAKYEIPENVYLFFEGLNKQTAKACLRQLSAFVKGTLDDDGIMDLIMYFDECAECDYGWIMIEQAMGFYQLKSEVKMDETIEEIKTIGTRSRTKNKRLSPLAGCFSPLNRKDDQTQNQLRSA